MKLIVRQLSGLGNQMFQYAAGRYYARQLDAELSLVIDPPHMPRSHGHPRPFLLSYFAIDAHYRELNRLERLMLFADDVATNSRRLTRVRPAVAGLVRGSLSFLRLQLVAETAAQAYRFQSVLPFHEQSKTAYLLGYWQVHQIPERISADLRREFVLRQPPAGKNLELQHLILSAENPVSVHIRRGDYTLQAEGNIALPMSYYAAALGEITKIVRNPQFFVFSDDMLFARNNFPPELRATFVDHNDPSTAYEDLRLMSSCRHHVIANSTLSWWGAWLDPRPDGIVMAPRNWMVGRRTRYDDLIPARWRLLG